MALLEIVAANGERTEPIEVEAGDRVLDACDEHAAPISFSCRTANCGACRVRVMRGGELLSAVNADEREVLSTWGAGPNERLACQLVIIGSDGVIDLRAIQAKPRSDDGAG